MQPLRIDVWSDIACPWCWVGKRHLEQAIEAAQRPVKVVWHAFELDPKAPIKHPEGTDYVQRLADKYNVAKPQAQEMIDTMTERGAGVGLDFRFDRTQATNTFDAHRLLAWAKDKGRQNELKERLFLAYMNQGHLISDHDVLCQIADEAGLDGEAAGRMLGGEAFSEEVRQDEATARQIGVQGVPFFVFDQRVGVSGAQPVLVLTEAILETTEAAALHPEVEAESCGPDGCEVPEQPSA